MRTLIALAIALLASNARAEALRDRTAPRLGQSVTCSIAAAHGYGVPANVLLAVAEIEGGRPGQWVRNRNGSYDVGPMQFNTRYLDHLRRHYGITAADVAAAGCYPYKLAAWRLSKHLARDSGDRWTRIANYHSRSPAANAKYRAKVMRAATRWAQWLSERFATVDDRAASMHDADPADAAGPRGRTGFRSGTTTAELDDEGDREDAETETLLRLINGGTAPRHRPSPPATTRDALNNAVQLPRHRAYTVAVPSRAWGTASTITRLRHAFDQLITIDPAAPKVRVHDVSLRRGGYMPGHRSHQSGRDVDITYYQRGCRGVCKGNRSRRRASTHGGSGACYAIGSSATKCSSSSSTTRCSVPCTTLPRRTARPRSN